MENKIMRIYYGNDCLPYKDHERTVHYPIVGKIGGGSVITGENNTTTIEFYVGLVGSNSKTWVATIKKPDGTLFYRVLNNGVAKDNDYVVSLDIAEIYANQVGNMVIGLNGYDGTTNISEEDDELIISGNTNCLALGTINVLCNYAPQVLTNAYGLDPSDLQLLLTAINQKANKVDTIIVVNQLNSTLEFADNQIVFSITDKKFYRYVESETYPDNYVVATDYYSTSEIDTFLSGKQDTLVSGVNIKTINGETLLGSGNINIQGGGGATYTAGNGITIDAQNQISADITQSTTNGYIKVGANNIRVYNDTNIREVAEGKCQSFVISDKLDIDDIKDDVANNNAKCFIFSTIVQQEIEDITSMVANGDFDNNVVNTLFDSQSDSVLLREEDISIYIVNIVVGYDEITEEEYNIYYFYDVSPQEGTTKEGDIILIKELDVPDRWLGDDGYAYKLETSKVDLSSYATKSELTNGLATKLSNTFSGATAYDNTATYAVGDRVLYNSKLYRCTTAVSTAEDFDSAKWTEITINDYPAKADNENITGNWTFGNVTINGKINHNASNYGLTLPDTSSYTADKEIATTDQAFNVINASDIVSNTLTQEQYDLITNGKITRIIGTLFNITNPLIIGCDIVSNYTYLWLIGGGRSPIIKSLRVFNTTLVVNEWTTNNLEIDNLSTVNGKLFPAYPTTNTSRQFFSIDANGGILSWSNCVPTNAYATNSTTQIEYETINNISISADTTFTLATAPTNTYPEYKANITNSGASNITITLPSGTVIKGNVSISSNTFVIPSGSSVEVNIQNSRAIVVEW